MLNKNEIKKMEEAGRYFDLCIYCAREELEFSLAYYKDFLTPAERTRFNEFYGLYLDACLADCPF